MHLHAPFPAGEFFSALYTSPTFEDFFGTAPPTTGVVSFPDMSGAITPSYSAPEPSTSLLVSLGLIGLASYRARGTRRATDA